MANSLYLLSQCLCRGFHVVEHVVVIIKKALHGLLRCWSRLGLVLAGRALSLFATLVGNVFTRVAGGAVGLARGVGAFRAGRLVSTNRPAGWALLLRADWLGDGFGKGNPLLALLQSRASVSETKWAMAAQVGYLGLVQVGCA